MRAVLTSPFYTINNRPTSHKSSQAHIYSAQLIETDVYHDMDTGQIKDFSDYDEMFVYHGNDFFGGLNLFGGVKGFGGVETLARFSQFKGKVYSLGIDFPDYAGMIRDRLKGDYPETWNQVDLENLERMQKESKTIKYPIYNPNVVIGDSHAICMYRPGWMVNSVPFKTLNGAINDGLETYLPDNLEGHINKVEWYFGNIDIRHHVCRLGDPSDTVPPLVKRYIEAVKKVPVKNQAIYVPLPIEDESRVLPKSGFYKGKPFYGSWEDRNRARNIFIEELKKSDIRIIEWTDYLTNSKGQLDFKHMEKPRSVHLSRASYPHWTGIQKEEEPVGLEAFMV